MGQISFGKGFPNFRVILIQLKSLLEHANGFGRSFVFVIQLAKRQQNIRVGRESGFSFFQGLHCHFGPAELRPYFRQGEPTGWFFGGYR